VEPVGAARLPDGRRARAHRRGRRIRRCLGRRVGVARGPGQGSHEALHRRRVRRAAARRRDRDLVSALDARYDENTSEAQAEYWLAHHIVLDGSAGDRGVVGFDLVWTRRW
jgi:hypothetical protein